MKRFKRWLEGGALALLAWIMGPAQLRTPPAKAGPMIPANDMSFLRADIGRACFMRGSPTMTAYHYAS